MHLLNQQLQAIRQSLARHEAHWTGGPLLAAVSGGRDSIVLLGLLHQLGQRGDLSAPVVVAHVDHGIHQQSALAADHVEAVAKGLGMAFSSRRLHRVGRSEAALREARYDALVSLARNAKARVVLTGHHADDDIETVLFRMMRGTGPRGLAGIPEFRRLAPNVAVLRPLLRSRRATLHRLLAHLDLPSLEDPTNLDLSYARNHLRHVVIPGLQEVLGAKLDAALIALLRTARAANDILEAQASRLLRHSASQPTPWRSELRLAPPSADDLPFVREAISQIYARVSAGGARRPSHPLVDRIVELLAHDAGQRVHGPGALLVERTRAGLLIVDQQAAGAPPANAIELPPPHTVRFGATEWAVRRRRHSQPPLTPTPSETGPRRALLAPPQTGEPWRLRRRRTGDRFWPLGAPAPVELRRFMQARHLPRFDRDRLPLVVDANDEILWVPGVEIAAPHRITLATSACFELELSIVGGIADAPAP